MKRERSRSPRRQPAAPAEPAAPAAGPAAPAAPAVASVPALPPSRDEYSDLAWSVHLQRAIDLIDGLIVLQASTPPEGEHWTYIQACAETALTLAQSLLDLFESGAVAPPLGLPLASPLRAHPRFRVL